MCKNNTHITAIFNFVFCKTKYKSYAKCKYHLNDTSVDDMPKSKQERCNYNSKPFVLLKEIHESIL